MFTLRQIMESTPDEVTRELRKVAEGQEDAYIDDFKRMLLTFILREMNDLDPEDIEKSEPASIVPRLTDAVEELHERIKGKITQKDITDAEVSSFVCSLMANRACNPLGKKIADALIRTASIRIFSDPEQSVMEPIANSIDSYNAIAGKPSIGKFGMGFFSVLYWIAQPNPYNEFVRELEIVSSYRTTEVQSYRVLLKWSADGLVFHAETLTPRDETGTALTIRSDGFDFTQTEIDLMVDNVLKFFCTQNIQIQLNGRIINEEFSQPTDPLVRVVLEPQLLSFTDWAQGIPREILYTSVLIPSSSSKVRTLINSDEAMRRPRFFKKQRNILKIIVNGVSVVNLETDGDDSIMVLLFMPSTTRLPVARDDIIYGDEEIKNLKGQLYPLMYEIMDKRHDLIPFMTIMEAYAAMSRQERLTNVVLEIKATLLASTIILIPKNDFWAVFTAKFPKDSYCYYPYPDRYRLSNQLYDTLSPFIQTDVFKSRLCIEFQEMPTDLNTRDLPVFTFYRGTIPNLIASSPNTLLIPSDSRMDIEFDEDDAVLMTEVKKGHDVFKDVYSSLLMTIKRKFTSIDFPTQREYFRSYVSAIVDASRRDDTIDDVVRFMYTLNSAISELSTSFTYGSGKSVALWNPVALVGYAVTGNRVYRALSKATNRTELEEVLKTFVSKSIKGENAVREYIRENTLSVYLMGALGRGIPTPKNTLTSQQDYDRVRDSIIQIFRTNRDLNSLQNRAWDYATKRLNTYIVENFTKDKGVSAIYLPLMSNVFPIEVFSIPKPEFNDEMARTVYECNTNEELFFYTVIIRALVGEFAVKLAESESPGLFRFILTELRRKYSNEYMGKVFREAISAWIGTQQTIANIVKSIVDAAMVYVNTLNASRPYPDPQMTYEYEFTCKELLAYVFNKTIPADLTGLVRDVCEFRRTMNPEDVRLQIVEIAVNEGTTKPFVQAVVSELVQNSIDAIGDSSGNISVLTYSDAFSVTDSVGIADTDTVLSLLIPFLSSKNPNDPSVNGEMGTGFFNVYRQPFVDHVNITTERDGKRIEIRATPLIDEAGFVRDVRYEFRSTSANGQNGTRIVVVLRGDGFPGLINDVSVFVNTMVGYNLESAIPDPYSDIRDQMELIENSSGNGAYKGRRKKTAEELKEVIRKLGQYSTTGTKDVLINRIKEIMKLRPRLGRNVEVSLNNVRLVRKTLLLYSIENVGEVLFTNDGVPSFVTTNRVPFSTLGDFCLDFPEIFKQFLEAMQSSIIVNLYKNAYVPSQARNKIRPVNRRAIIALINNGLYMASLYVYTHDCPSPDRFIVNTSSTQRIGQLGLYTMNPPPRYNSYMVNPGNRAKMDSEYFHSLFTSYDLELFEFDQIGRNFFQTALALTINHIANRAETPNTGAFVFTLNNVTFGGKLGLNDLKAIVLNSKNPAYDTVRGNTVDFRLYYDAIIKWCSNKDFSAQEEVKIVLKDELVVMNKKSKKIKKEEEFTEDDIKTPWEELQPFVDIYWQKLLELVAAKVIVGPVLNPNPPIILHGKLKKMAGVYMPADHCIVMSEKEDRPALVNAALAKLRTMSVNDACIELTTNPPLSSLFATNTNTTLLHELGHAVQNTKHNGSTHGLTNTAVRGSKKLMFDEMCVSVYLEANRLGLLTEYIGVIKS
jgi:hypothetical protein